MGTFSAGWHSYSFKSMLKSRFGPAVASAKEGKEAEPINRPPVTTVPPNPSFQDGVATKDISIDDDIGLAVRIYLPACCVQPGKINDFGWMMKRLGSATDWLPKILSPEKKPRPSSGGPGTGAVAGPEGEEVELENSDEFWQGVNGQDDANGKENVPENQATDGEGAARKTSPAYTGYMPKVDSPDNHKLPVIVQFHDGPFVVGQKDSTANDIFCRRLARVCNAIVVAVGYRLAPENKCPGAYDDGYEVLKWLAKQAILADVEKDHLKVQLQQQQQQQEKQLLQAAQRRAEAERSTESQEGEADLGGAGGGAAEESNGGAGGLREGDAMDGGLAMGMLQDMVDPWLAVHADVSRCLLLGVSGGGNIADQVTRRGCTPQGVNDLNPLVIAGQVLLYPLFGGSMRTPSESKAKDAYFFDVPTCELVFRLLLPDSEFSMDHPAVNPMLREQLPPGMPPTLLVVADHDILTDRIIAYSVFLRNFGVETQVNSYKDVVHGFASHPSMVNTPQAEACIEDIAMWIAKHIAAKGSELSY